MRTQEGILTRGEHRTWRMAIPVSIAVLGLAAAVVWANRLQDEITTPAGEVTDPRPFLARFMNDWDDSDSQKRESLASIWAAIPEKGRLDGLIEIANADDERAGIAMATAVIGDRAGAAKKARERATMKGFRINPAMMAMTIFEACDSFEEALAIGRELLAHDSRRARTVGHHLLSFSTNWPIEPHPMHAKPADDVGATEVENWKALEKETWTPRTILEASLERFITLDEGKLPAAREARFFFIDLVTRDLPTIPATAPEEIRNERLALNSLLATRNPEDLEKLRALIPEGLSWEQMKRRWRVLRHVGVEVR